MMGHRAGYSVGLPRSGLPTARTDARVDPAKFSGYSYFLGNPGANRTTLGDDPAKAREILEALYSFLPVANTEDNKDIPSGYTYLLQFVAHDLVETTVPFWAAAEAGVPSRNMRDQRLGLDTLYGGGPVACPIAFEPAGAMVDYRTQLRLGRVSDVATLGVTTPACPFRDLARLKQDAAQPPGNVDNPSQVYVADERSDDNTLVSQIVVLFSIVHNAIAAKMAHLGPQASFSHATTAVLSMYHRIIRHDLMSRLLFPPVYNSLVKKTKDGPWLWKGDGVPLEFTHGAFRVGHAMVRPFYQMNTDNRFSVNEVLGGPIVGDPIRDPLPASWIVEWQHFFEFENRKRPNYSLKLAVHQQMPLNFVGQFQPVAANSPDHLMVRDWLSAANARMVKLDTLIAAVMAGYHKVKPMSTAEIKRWLTDLLAQSPRAQADKALIRDNIDLLTTNLPLPLYILLEAQSAEANAGATLGPLGSVIVGETIFRCLTAAEDRLTPLLHTAQHALGADDWGQIAAVESMPALVELAQDWGGLRDCPQIPFIAP